MFRCQVEVSIFVDTCFFVFLVHQLLTNAGNATPHDFNTPELRAQMHLHRSMKWVTVFVVTFFYSKTFQVKKVSWFSKNSLSVAQYWRGWRAGFRPASCLSFVKWQSKSKADTMLEYLGAQQRVKPFFCCVL